MITYDSKLQPGDVVALGDIHATAELYFEFLDWVKDSSATVILLGDMIDRGKRDLEVLDATRTLLEYCEGWGLQAFYALMGNHERMFLDGLLCSQSYRLWIENGGNAQQVDAMEREHRDWIRDLPLYMTIGDTMFIHGGIFPGHNPAEDLPEKAESFLWMRDPFLKFGPQFKKWNPRLKRVVHGHTPTFFERDGEGFDEERGVCIPVVKKDRVNIDTGACFRKEGCLTAYNVTQNTFRQFLRI